MEKRKPHYSLELIISLIEQRKYSITRIALDNAAEDFDLNRNEIISEIKNLTRENFYKAMTVHCSSQRWQDVYHKDISNQGLAYIKLQIVNESSVIIQFKRK